MIMLLKVVPRSKLRYRRNGSLYATTNNGYETVLSANEKDVVTSERVDDDEVVQVNNDENENVE